VKGGRILMEFYKNRIIGMPDNKKYDPKGIFV
jgi:hypothetical protein